MAETDGTTLLIRSLVFLAVAGLFFFVLKSKKNEDK